MQEIDIRKRIAATPEVIYRLLDDSPTWPSWTPMQKATGQFVEGLDCHATST